MPTLYTHYKFGNDVLNKLKKSIKLSINDNISYYNIFNQVWDNLYYHWRLNYYKKLGVISHKKKVSLFIANLITFIKDNDLQETYITCAVYGFLNHYILDTIVHPYINYQVKNLNIPHTKIEFILDNMIFRDNNTEKWNGKLFKLLIPKMKFEKDLIKALDYAFEKTHNHKNIGKVFNISHNNGYYLYRYFIYDKLGIKRYIYKLIDFLFPFKKTEFHKCTYNTNDFNEKTLNNEKNYWHYPNNKNEMYNYSFFELYNYSLKIATKLNNLTYKVINNKSELSKLTTLIDKINIKNIQELLKK